mmetsp:Transcript_13294/g.27466  ORF Transcript_13294/g.27466 Transcript_13294/m.27466 type:complete len:292 (-) Transcript_13294:130-1005(-)
MGHPQQVQSFLSVRLRHSRLRLPQPRVPRLHVLLLERSTLHSARRSADLIHRRDVPAAVGTQQSAARPVRQQGLTEILQRRGATLLILLRDGLHQLLLGLFEIGRRSVHVLGEGDLDVRAAAQEARGVQFHGENSVLGDFRGEVVRGLPIPGADHLGRAGDGVVAPLDAGKVSLLVGGVVVIGPEVRFDDRLRLHLSDRGLFLRLLHLLDLGGIGAVVVEEAGIGDSGEEGRGSEGEGRSEHRSPGFLRGHGEGGGALLPGRHRRGDEGRRRGGEGKGDGGGRYSHGHLID